MFYRPGNKADISYRDTRSVLSFLLGARERFLWNLGGEPAAPVRRHGDSCDITTRVFALSRRCVGVPYRDPGSRTETRGPVPRPGVPTETRGPVPRPGVPYRDPGGRGSGDASEAVTGSAGSLHTEADAEKRKGEHGQFVLGVLGGLPWQHRQHLKEGGRGETS